MEEEKRLNEIRKKTLDANGQEVLYEKPLDEKSNKRIKRYMPKRGSYKKTKS